MTRDLLLSPEGNILRWDRLHCIFSQMQFCLVFGPSSIDGKWSYVVDEYSLIQTINLLSCYCHGQCYLISYVSQLHLRLLRRKVWVHTTVFPNLQSTAMSSNLFHQQIEQSVIVRVVVVHQSDICMNLRFKTILSAACARAHILSNLVEVPVDKYEPKRFKSES